MRITSLGSGSSGNAFLIQSNGVALLLDCGVATRTCASALGSLDPGAALGAVVVSHEHIDHVRALGSILRRHAVPLVTSGGTYGALNAECAWSRIAHGTRFAIGSLEVTFVGVSHDAAEPCGFVVDDGSERVAIFTDLGIVTPVVADALRDVDVRVLEANYDRHMLRNGRYPAHLKRRISGPAGHLSNDDCAGALVATLTTRTRSVWLAHLSENNNAPGVALATVHEALHLNGIVVDLAVLPRHGSAELMQRAPEQLTLRL